MSLAYMTNITTAFYVRRAPRTTWAGLTISPATDYGNLTGLSRMSLILRREPHPPPRVQETRVEGFFAHKRAFLHPKGWGQNNL
eukprot:13088453-Ditylum_brightwellii.AAC.1